MGSDVNNSNAPIALAGLLGAAGVVLAALAAHAKPGSSLDSAAQMLLIHALAIIGASALACGSNALWLPAATGATWAWLLGAAIFAGDIALRSYAGTRLFPMAAPIGGSLLIAGWLAFAVAAVFARR